MVYILAIYIGNSIVLLLFWWNFQTRQSRHNNVSIVLFTTQYEHWTYTIRDACMLVNDAGRACNVLRITQ